MNIDEQIKKTEEELTRLKRVKELDDAKLINRVTKIVHNSQVFDYHGQNSENVRILDNGRNSVIIEFSGEFSTWNLVHNLIDKGINIYNIYSRGNNMTFVLSES